MIQSKKINIIVVIAMFSALIICVAFIAIGNMQDESDSVITEAEYVTKIFGTEIISIEIIADETDWQEMLDNAASEQYIMADVVVNGTKFQNVGVRPKGNSSLTQVASTESDRYSFRLQFDEYIKGQTCFGLESFVVNNMLGDNTYMKEYVSYELMREIGVDAPYYGYADIKVNGESWGLYLAVELYNDSYEQRVYGDTEGLLYNVKSMDMGGNQLGEQKGNFQVMPYGQNSRPERSKEDFQDTTLYQGQMQGEFNRNNGFFGGNGGRGSTGGSLEYTDDNTESYSAIFDNVVGKGTESDYQRVVEALKALSEGKDLESYFDVDQILRYLAAHTIVVNLDSYSSSMAQNYYIYELDGQITILPWDYNLAWGGFQNSSTSSVVNFPIDSPLSGVEMSSRPLIEKLLANNEYLERYHNYLQQLIDNYFANGKFEEKINSLDALINGYVQKDTTAFCTFEEYKTAISTFITLGNLRALSVQGQLDGTVPSTTTVQNANTDQLIETGDLNLSDLGSMMEGKGDNNSDFPGKMGGQENNSFPVDMNNGIDVELMNKAIDIIRQANGEITDQVTESLLSLGLTAEQIEQLSNMGGGQFSGRAPGVQGINSSTSSDTNIIQGQKMDSNNLIIIAVLSLVLMISLLFVARYKKSY